MRRPILVTALLVVAALAATTSSHAARRRRVDLEPVLRVHTDRLVRLRTLFQPPPPYRIVHDLLVSRGGATSFMLTEVAQCYPLCDGAPTRQFVAGRASNARLAALKDFFVNQPVGSEPMCLIANDYSLPTGVINFGRMEVEWYGNPGPTRLFTIFWGDVESFADLPACGDSERAALTAIAAFEEGTRGAGLQPLQCPLQ